MKKFSLLFISCFSVITFAQSELVFVYFKDKPNKNLFYANPLIELSQKSLDRRASLGIVLNDQDAPIEPSYLQNLSNLGYIVTDYSKWLNGVALTVTPVEKTTIEALPFVHSVQTFVKNSTGVTRQNYDQTQSQYSKFAALLSNFNYGTGATQIDQVNLRNLHVSGYTGTGISIAVIDTGFPTVDTGSSFSRIRNNNQVKGGYNFIHKNSNIYSPTLSNHGTSVLGVMAGYIDGVFVGSAPDAEFYLYATEDHTVEKPEEEIYWIMAAEEADRKGVDIINTSLGYNVYDDARYNYTYTQMDGQTSFISRGAQIATEKGILVVVANGNQGQSTWHYLTAPADNEKVFSIGSVDASGVASGFSSYGPNAANVVKPDASALGSAAVFTIDNSTSTGSGTSLSTPIAAGGMACLLQAYPTMNREYLKSLLRSTASLYPSTDPQLGYGVLNFGNAYTMALQVEQNKKNIDINIYPNPTSDYLYVKSNSGIKLVELYNALGQLIISTIEDVIYVGNYKKGNYYIKIKTQQGETVKKITVK